MTEGRFEELAGELDRFAEQLAELGMDVLRNALDSGDDGAAVATKRAKTLNRAIASVEKAAVLVRRAADAHVSEGRERSEAD